MKWLASSALFILISLPQAHAASTLHLFQVSNLTAPTPTTNTGALNIQGGGMLLGFGRGSFSLLTGGAYLTQTLNGVNSGHILIPFLLRLHFMRFFSLRFGGDVNYQLEKIPSNLSGLDYGVVGGVGLDLPLSYTFGIALALDYHYGLNNLAVGGGTFNMNQYQAWAGLKFGRGR